MFWNKKRKSILPVADEVWVETSYRWFEKTFQIDLSNQTIILPTQEFLGFKFTGKAQDATNALMYIAQVMKIDPKHIRLHFFSDFKPVDLTDDGIQTKYAESTQLNTGSYLKVADNQYEIGIEKTVLQKPMSLMAVLAYELAHVKLLGEGKIEKVDKPLIDLAAALFGFVIFQANASVAKMTSWSKHEQHFAWTVNGVASYLHHKVYAFLLAYWMLQRGENKPKWLNMLDDDVLYDVKKAYKYLTQK